ncbi:MAG: relaxase/mobilization nuclease domain-containing protein [Oscillospiraceae bacterium]|nr:relaxase/mobilization nuclease domain-containing protein [Oscillospiraceae bacterium]
MATTGFWPIKGRLKDAIDYAENPDKTTDSKYLDEDLYNALRYAGNDEKTDKKMYVSAINCPKQQAYESMMDTKRRYGKLGGNVAYHGYQSFKTGEVTPQEAHTIGMETARRMWGDDYEIVVTTHLNTDNIHNHIVVNSVSFRTGRKFENHVSDHYRLREISDAVCQEYGKSVLKNAKFYGGEKGAYWVHKNGGMTHRDILRRDVDEALSKVSTYHAFFEYLEGLGYKLRGNVDSPNLSVIAEGWQRPVRLKSLGKKYTPDAIYDQLMRNQRKPELFWIAMPVRKRVPLLIIERAYKEANRMDGLQLTFAIFTELLKICTGNNLAENENLPLSPLLREEVRKLDKYIEDYKLLCDCHIDTAEELFAFRENVDAQIEELKAQREHIRNKIRRAPEAEKGELKLAAKAVTEKITPLRKQQRSARRIAERIPKVENLLAMERQQETEFTRTRTRNGRSYTR